MIPLIGFYSNVAEKNLNDDRSAKCTAFVLKNHQDVKSHSISQSELWEFEDLNRIGDMQKTGGLFEIHHDIHVLNRLAGRTLNQIVNRRQ
jgi:hypothetical protein